ncbi:hypothetical protein FHG87_021000 [Trinorchestia longiramus]|nr:hypothetical protein FHG87_021000 [Trinorchestia longiramus]
MMLEIEYGYSKDFKVKFGGDKSRVMVINADETDSDKEWNIGEVKIGRTKEYNMEKISRISRGYLVGLDKECNMTVVDAMKDFLVHAWNKRQYCKYAHERESFMDVVHEYYEKNQ